MGEKGIEGTAETRREGRDAPREDQEGIGTELTFSVAFLCTLSSRLRVSESGASVRESRLGEESELEIM